MRRLRRRLERGRGISDAMRAKAREGGWCLPWSEALQASRREDVRLGMRAGLLQKHFLSVIVHPEACIAARMAGCAQVGRAVSDCALTRLQRPGTTVRERKTARAPFEMAERMAKGVRKLPMLIDVPALSLIDEIDEL